MLIQPKQHLKYVDGLRATAAIYVVMHHAYLQYTTSNLPKLQRLILSIFKSGHYAVDLFIVISGFSLMLTVLKKDYRLNSIKEFYVRRIRRILPPYFIAMAFSLLAIYTLIGSKTGNNWDITLPVNFKSVLLHIFLINDVFSSEVYKINHAFWSIPVECRIYIFFPFLLLLLRRFGYNVTIAFSVLLSVGLFLLLFALRKYYSDINLKTPGVNPYIILFTLGMIAADISFGISANSKRLRSLPWNILIIISAFAFIFFKSIIGFSSNSNGSLGNEFVDVLFGIFSFSILIKCSSDQNNLFNKAFSIDILSKVGIFSYSIYLIHAPLLQIFTVYILPMLKLNTFTNVILLTTIGLLIIVGISYIFHILFEKPFLRKKAVKVNL